MPHISCSLWANCKQPTRCTALLCCFSAVSVGLDTSNGHFHEGACPTSVVPDRPGGTLWTTQQTPPAVQPPGTGKEGPSLSESCSILSQLKHQGTSRPCSRTAVVLMLNTRPGCGLRRASGRRTQLTLVVLSSGIIPGTGH